MPSSSERKRQDHPEVVELAPGIAVPTAFVYTRSGGPPLGSYSVRIVTDPTERMPRLVEYLRVFETPPAVADLDDDRLRLMVEHAIAQEAAGLAQQRLREFVVDDSELTAELQTVRDRAVMAVRPKPGRRPVSDQEKLRILELYRTKGIEGAMASTGKAERTIRRYVADARQIERGNR